MMKIVMRLILLALMLVGEAHALEIGKVDIGEWLVPWERTRPRDPFVETRNRVWFVGQKGDYLAYFNQEGGQFERFDLVAGVGPHNVIVDGEGFVWYAGNLKAHIGKLDPLVDLTFVLC